MKPFELPCMGSSEIWDKYHECCIEIFIFNATRVLFIPNFTATHFIHVNTIFVLSDGGLVAKVKIAT